ncbi:uncharacterized protein TNCV_3511691 [Trichonephila clavipes]|nr:uncharacterized protein TNCV_3511691 [Trichonephila clavipes]
MEYRTYTCLGKYADRSGILPEEGIVASKSLFFVARGRNPNDILAALTFLEIELDGEKVSVTSKRFGSGAVELDILSDLCSYSYKFYSSKKCKAEIGKHSNYEINTRFVYAMRCIGKGAEAARMFCAIMNLPPSPTKLSKYNKMLLGTTKDVCAATMKAAVEQAVQENQNIRDIPVKVGWNMAEERKFLHEWCRDNKTKNGPVCKKNFDGYSGRMEVDGAISIFQRSVQRYDVRYTKYLGDGDTKDFDNIVKNNVCDDNCMITKLECIGHVMKQMGSRLQRFKDK